VREMERGCTRRTLHMYESWREVKVAERGDAAGWVTQAGDCARQQAQSCFRTAPAVVRRVGTRSTDGDDGDPAAECVAAVVKRCTVRCVHNGGRRRWQRGEKKIGKTMLPQRTNPALTTDVPHGEGSVLVFNSLNIET
jgi:hypothetical protein